MATRTLAVGRRPAGPRAAAPTPPTTTVPAPRAASGAPARIFVRDTQGHEHAWHRALPEALIELCSYIPMGVVYRVRPGYAITLSLADPARVVARTSIQGEKPAACPASVSVKVGGGGGTNPWQIGDEPRAETVVAGLRPVALGSR